MGAVARKGVRVVRGPAYGVAALLATAQLLGGWVGMGPAVAAAGSTVATVVIQGERFRVPLPPRARPAQVVGTMAGGWVYWVEPPAMRTAPNPEVLNFGVPAGPYEVYAEPRPKAGGLLDPAHARRVTALVAVGARVGREPSYLVPDALYVTARHVVMATANVVNGWAEAVGDPVYLAPMGGRPRLLVTLANGGGVFSQLTAGDGYVLWEWGTDLVDVASGGPIINWALLYSVRTGVAESLPAPPGLQDVALSAATARVGSRSWPLDAFPHAWEPPPSLVSAHPAVFPAGAAYPADWPDAAHTTVMMARGGFRITAWEPGPHRSRIANTVLSEGSLARYPAVPALIGGKPMRLWGTVSVMVSGHMATWREGGFTYVVRLTAKGPQRALVESMATAVLQALPPSGNPVGPGVRGLFVMSLTEDAEGGVGGGITLWWRTRRGVSPCRM